MSGKKAIFNPFTNRLQYYSDSAIIESRVANLENNEYEITYFTEISAATGTIIPPAGATILLDQFFGGIDAYVSEIENGQPNGEFPKTSLGDEVDVSSFDAMGNYTLSDTPASYPVALIYKFKIKAVDYSNIDLDYLLDFEDITIWEDGYPTYDERYAPIGTISTTYDPVISVLNTPPAHVLGERYLIGTAPTGDWSGLANQIAESDGVNWTYTIPVTDSTVYVTNTLSTYRFNGTNWILYPGQAILQDGNQVGGVLRIGTKDSYNVELIRGNSAIARLTNNGMVLLGNPTTPNQAANSNNTRIANTAYVDNAVNTIDTITDNFLLGGM